MIIFLVTQATFSDRFVHTILKKQVSRFYFTFILPISNGLKILANMAFSHTAGRLLPGQTTWFGMNIRQILLEEWQVKIET
jgi:hypothetical protein